MLEGASGAFIARPGQFDTTKPTGKTPRMKNQTFGELLARVRKSKGVFAIDLARFLDISTNYLAHVEHGRRYPFDPEKIQRIASFLGVEAGPLLRAAVETRNRTQKSLQKGYALVMSTA